MHNPGPQPTPLHLPKDPLRLTPDPLGSPIELRGGLVVEHGVIEDEVDVFL